MTQETLANRMRSGPFTLSTDGSNDAGSKQFPIVIRTLNPDTKLVTSEVLSVPVCYGSATGLPDFMSVLLLLSNYNFFEHEIKKKYFSIALEV